MEKPLGRGNQVAESIALPAPNQTDTRVRRGRLHPGTLALQTSRSKRIACWIYTAQYQGG